jgi:pimeloyl-ACP methyl ester carboxylesterase
MGIVIWGVFGIIVAYLLVRAARFFRTRARRRRENAAAFAVRTPNGIDAGRFVRLGGVEQWIQIRGEDRANPIVLVLHGGPATSYMGLIPMFRPWERSFTVVQWDRRGVGRTFGRNGRRGCGEMTLERIADDAAELAQFLSQHLNKRKIILLGHSMGSIIGITAAARHPDRFHAYVGTEQIIDMPANEALSYRIILEKVRSQGDSKRVKALERIGPPPYARPRDWGTKQFAAEAADPVYGEISKRMRDMELSSPNLTLGDNINLIRGALFCISKLYAQWHAFEASRFGRQFQTPIFIIEGPTDVMTPPELARAWIESIEAPAKAMVELPGASHLAFATAAEAYLAELIGRVRPLAVEGDGATGDGPPAQTAQPAQSAGAVRNNRGPVAAAA